MPRVMCVWFPRWPIQRLRNTRPELKRCELGLFASRRERPTITECSPNAERLGIHIGQPLAEAKALLPNAKFIPADLTADRDALCQLAVDCQKYSPMVGLEDGDPPESLLCDVTGCTHLWNGEECFLEAVRDYWRGRRYHVGLALAGTIGAAWALAHTATFSLVAVGDEEAALSGLPVEALRLPPLALERLEALGLWTIGEVMRLPRQALVSRFGTVLSERLDQMLGLLPETFICERLKEPLAVVREWEEPKEDRFALALLCRQMLRELLAQAGQHGLGIQELVGEIQTETDPVAIEIRLVEPTRDEQHLAQLVELQLERQSWSGGVVAVRLSAPLLGRSTQAQGHWFGDDSDAESTRAFHSLVDRLGSRLGGDRVLRAEFAAEAQPEYAVRLVPWTGAKPAQAESFSHSQQECRERPLRLLAIPEALDVVSIVPDGPPLRMTCHREDHLVVRSWGPERIETGWWRARDVERDYYRAEWDNGTHVWVYRDHRAGRWFLHGYFD
jgi:protein ImuB